MGKLTEKQKEYLRQWRKKNPTYQKKWRLKNPNYVKNYEAERRKDPNHKRYMKKFHLKKYGMSLQKFDKMKAEQKNACKICLQKEDDKNVLCVDHSHITGKVRGLLCSHCNKALGLVLDSLHILGRMRGYLLQTDHYPKITAKHLKTITNYNKRVNNGGIKIVNRELLSKQAKFVTDIVDILKDDKKGTLEKFIK